MDRRVSAEFNEENILRWRKGDRQSGIDYRKNRKNGEQAGIHDKIAPFQFEHLAATRAACNDHGWQENARVDMWTIA
jgi:hypothetical protein